MTYNTINQRLLDIQAAAGRGIRDLSLGIDSGDAWPSNDDMKFVLRIAKRSDCNPAFYRTTDWILGKFARVYCEHHGVEF